MEKKKEEKKKAVPLSLSSKKKLPGSWEGPGRHAERLKQRREGEEGSVGGPLFLMKDSRERQWETHRKSRNRETMNEEGPARVPGSRG